MHPTPTTAQSVPPQPMFRQIDPNGWKTPSRSHPTVSHTIRRQPDGSLICSCPARVRCQHLKDFECEQKAAVMPPASHRQAQTPVVDPDCDDPFSLEPVKPQPKPASRPKLSAWEDEWDPFAGMPLPTPAAAAPAPAPLLTPAHPDWYAALAAFETDTLAA